MTTLTVCDSCLNVAYDEGFEDEDAIPIMVDMGSDLEDHLCDEVESEGEIKCGCVCRRRRKV